MLHVSRYTVNTWAAQLKANPDMVATQAVRGRKKGVGNKPKPFAPVTPAQGLQNEPNSVGYVCLDED
ncbi:hypothetical protein ACI3PL_25320, partial [Lacticaseibacillus paracasei]